MVKVTVLTNLRDLHGKGDSCGVCARFAIISCGKNLFSLKYGILESMTYLAFEVET